MAQLAARPTFGGLAGARWSRRQDARLNARWRTRPAGPARDATGRSRIAAVGLLALVLAGCGSCDEEHAVPFKLDAGATPGTATMRSPDAATDPLAMVPGAFAARDGRTHGEGTRRVDVAGAAIEIAEGSIRASLDVDLDADQDPDALLVRTDATGASALVMGVREAAGYATPRTIEVLAPAAGCALEDLALRQFAPGFVSVRAQARCTTSLPASMAAATPTAPRGPRPSTPATGAAVGPTGPAAPTPPAPKPGVPAHAQPTTPAPPAPITQHLWIATVEALPRSVAHVDWDAALHAEPDAMRVQDVALTGADFDADGHDDIEVRVALRHALDTETATLALKMLDRPAGLARDPAEPETTLRALADKARDKLRRDPARALAGADQVLALYAALCREGGRPAVRFDDVGGLPCGRSRAAGRATAIRVAALARTGALPAAIDGLGMLDNAAYEVPTVDRDRVRDAFAAIASTTLAWRKGPPLAPAPAPAAHLSDIAFIDEDSLLLRGTPPARYAITDASATPAGVDGNPLITDPSGRWAAVNVFRDCDGYRLRVVSAAQVVAGIVAGASASEPLVVAVAPPPGAPCPGTLPPASRADDGGLRVLDWIEGGVLFARGDQLWRLALDGDAKATAPAAPVAPTDSVRPRHAGAISESGRHLALVTKLGVAVVDRTSGATLLVPLAGSELESAGATMSTATQVAVSPSGRRVAITHGGHVYVTIEKPPEPVAPAAPGAPPAPGATAPAPGASQAPPPRAPPANAADAPPAP